MHCNRWEIYECLAPWELIFTPARFRALAHAFKGTLVRRVPLSVVNSNAFAR
jgi:hypothetical protein